MNERLTARNISQFLIGREDAIRKVAGSSSAIWTGIALTLLTAFARNYDQTFIAEKPFLWFFGPLLFSLVSGTWLYFICYTLCARRHFPADEANSEDSWRGFMGPFWMTAPIAWLYAIPVERFFDSVGAAQANVLLLTIVSIWRVLLMGKVLGVVTNVPFPRALMWVVVGASVEVFVITFIGGTLANAIGRGMMGMRNSPEEEILLNAMSNAAGIAMFGFIAATIGLWFWRLKDVATPWPEIRKSSTPWMALAVALAFACAITVPNQLQLRRNYTIEQLMAEGKMREALNQMALVGKDGFAPARPLPPRMFESDSANNAFQLAGLVTDEDDRWIVEHASNCLETSIAALASGKTGDTPVSDLPPDRFKRGIYLFNQFEPEFAVPLLARTNRPAPIEMVLNRYQNFLITLRVAAERGAKPSEHDDSRSDAWGKLKEYLDARGVTNAALPDVWPPQSNTPTP